MMKNAGHGEGGLPAVSVVMPCRDEAGHIEGCIGSILANDYQGALELIVADGMSTDGTRQAVADIARKDPRVRMIDNPKGIVPSAMNAGIRAARGEVVVRADAHTLYASDYVRRCVECLEETGADNVGGAMRVKAATPFEKAVALATGSRFGVGNAHFHFEGHEGYVDTVYLGAYRKGVFDSIGMFDEELVRNQDDEFNYRLVKSGGRIYMSPAIKSWYCPRGSALKLWRQYFGYGYYKVRVIKKHGAPASVRHLVPGAFVFSLAMLPPIGALFVPALWLAGALAISYAALTGASTAWICLTKRPGTGPALRLPPVFAILHLGYGAGFIKGVADLVGQGGAAARWQGRPAREG